MIETEYKLDTGEICMTFSFQDEESSLLNHREGYGYISGTFYGDSYYVKDGVATERPIMSVSADKSSINADGLDALTISGLPTGNSDISLIGPINDKWSEAERKIQITVNVAGTYRVFISQWPYQYAGVTFNAT